MKVLHNLIPIKSGGGLQVAKNYIQTIINNYNPKNHHFVISNVQSLLDTLNSYGNFTVIENSYFKRSIFERFKLTKFIEKHGIDIIYTMFGPGLNHKKIPSVTGSAYSNLYYPDINFWGEWPFHKKKYYRIRDIYRLHTTLNSDGWVFETENIRRKAIRLYDLPSERSITVKPSPSEFVKPKKLNKKVADRCKQLPDHYKVLLLSGWHKNKNLEVVPKLLKILRDDFNETDISFVLTVPENHKNSKRILREAQDYGVADRLVLFGLVPPEGCVELYRNTQCTLLLSLLESFSNNILETWAMQKPLIITDHDWAKGICEDAALYVNRNSPSNIAQKLKKMKDDKDLANRISKNGNKKLSEHPDFNEKVSKQIKFLKKINNKGKLDA